MSFVPAIVDYSRRQVDVELLQSVAAPVSEQRVVLSNVSSTPKIVTGIEKAVQRYAVLILTTIGEVHFDPATGSELVSSILNSGVHDRGYLGHLFGMANAQALRLLAADDDDPRFGGTPDDERIQSGSLEDVVIDYVSGTVSLTVLLTTAADTQFSFIVPIGTAR